MMSLVRSFIILFLFATSGAAQTLPLEQLLKQQSQGLPSGSDLQSLENILSEQGFETNPPNDTSARRAKDPVIPNEQNVEALNQRLAKEEAQKLLQEGASYVERFVPWAVEGTIVVNGRNLLQSAHW